VVRKSRGTNHQAEWLPGQVGRWKVTDFNGTPIIQFKDFPMTSLSARLATGRAKWS
jgi:hypothetical protein